MLELGRILIDGAAVSLVASVALAAVLWYNPRLLMNDYPPEIRQLVPPKTDRESRLGLIVGMPFLLVLLLGPLVSTWAMKRSAGGSVPFWVLATQAFGVGLVFNLVDLVMVDWLVFCTITPRFLVLPGSEGAEGYKDYMFHARAALKGTVFCVLWGLIVGAIVYAL